MRMQTTCDIYLLEELIGSSTLINRLTILDPFVHFEATRNYSGFLGLNLKRINAVSAITHLKANGVKCLNIPIIYRDQTLISEEEAEKFAIMHTTGRGIITGKLHMRNTPRNPMFWYFVVNRLVEIEVSEGDGIVVIDALDGHIWGTEELSEYLYDYNNCL
jgi:hypothetical protein